MKLFIGFVVFVLPLIVLYFFKREHTTAVVSNKTLLLVMVKNEAAIISRLLSSAKDRAAYLYVCDTGSTDETWQVIKSTWKDHSRFKIDTNHTPFVNFEENRNRCKDAARDFLNKHTEWNVEWVITADADYTLVDRHPNKMPEHAMNVIQIHGTPHNSLNMLFERNFFFTSCQYKLWTHEFLDCGPQSVAHHFDGFYFVDYADGKNREEKTKRDILLLTQWLHEKNTSDVRSRALYYLARAYEDAGLYEAALHCYEKHNAENNYTNYQFYALYRMAIITLKTSNQSGSVEEAFLKAIDAYDGYFRKEPYYYLTRYFREQGQLNKCIMYGTAGLYAPQIDHTRMPLFLESVIYDWALEEELGFCKLLKGNKAEAKFHFEKILQRNDLDNATRIRINNNVF